MSRFCLASSHITPLTLGTVWGMFNIRRTLEISSGDVVSPFDSFICYMMSSIRSSALNQTDAELLSFGWCMNLVSEGLWVWSWLLSLKKWNLCVWALCLDHIWQNGCAVPYICGPASSVGIATELRAEWSVDRIPVGRDFPPVRTGPGAQPASCTMGTGCFPVVKYGRGVLLTTHPLLVPPSWKNRAIPVPTLWATTGPVTGSLYHSIKLYSYRTTVVYGVSRWPILRYAARDCILNNVFFHREDLALLCLSNNGFIGVWPWNMTHSDG